MAENGERLQRLMSQLEQQRDELKVKFGLAKLEAREEWQELERKMDALKGRMKVVGSEAKEASADVAAAADMLADEIKDGFEKLKKLI